MQAVAGVTLQIHADGRIHAAGLEGGASLVDAGIRHCGMEEEQGAFRTERRDDARVGGRTIQIGAGREANFRLLGIAVGRQVEAIRHAQAKAEVPGPADVQGEAAVDIEGEAGDVEGQWNGHAGAQELLPQGHVELDGVRRGGQLATLAPQADQVAGLVVPGRLHVIDVDVPVMVGIHEDLDAIRPE